VKRIGENLKEHQITISQILSYSRVIHWNIQTVLEMIKACILHNTN